jgi:hypothetical protein
MQKQLTAARVADYLQRCNCRNFLVEDGQAHVPPSHKEVHDLMRHLKANGIKAAIAGSVGILHHVDLDASKFRPTHDLDIWVNQDPGNPPPGWRRDPESIGLVSWISPSGGYVDFMRAGDEFPGGTVVPRSIDVSAEFEHPVAGWKSLLAMKLNSMREKDLADSIALVRQLGRVPSPRELGKLTVTQRENLDLVGTWFKLRPHGAYGS